MFFLRKLVYFNVDSTLLCLFYRSVVESLLTFCLTAWGGNTRIKDKEKINRLIRKASKLSSYDFHYLNELYHISCSRKINTISQDSQHPMHSQIKRSARSNRPLLLLCNKEKYKRSFLPSSIKLLS